MKIAIYISERIGNGQCSPEEDPRTWTESTGAYRPKALDMLKHEEGETMDMIDHPYTHHAICTVWAGDDTHDKLDKEKKNTRLSDLWENEEDKKAKYGKEKLKDKGKDKHDKVKQVLEEKMGLKTKGKYVDHKDTLKDLVRIAIHDTLDAQMDKGHTIEGWIPDPKKPWLPKLDEMGNPITVVKKRPFKPVEWGKKEIIFGREKL
jgi:hypothetical protein